MASLKLDFLFQIVKGQNKNPSAESCRAQWAQERKYVSKLNARRSHVEHSYNISELLISDMSPSQDMPGLYSVVVCLLIFSWGSELKLSSYKDFILDKIDVLA